MKDLMHKSTWDRPYTMLSWGSLIVALFSSIIFFAAFGGTAWWVEYYQRPDGQIIALEAKSFGLFRLCNRGDCVVDITNRPLIKAFVPFELQRAAMHDLPACQWLMSFAVFFIIILLFAYIAFLVGAKTLYSEVWLQFIISILIITSVAVFGNRFRGTTPYFPFGWSYWLAVIAAILFLINCMFVLFVSVAVRKKDAISPMKMYALNPKS